MALTQTSLKELLDYDPETGVFVWKESTSNRVRAGAKAGSVGSSGYSSIQINRKLYLSHRLAWFYVTGLWPNEFLDHIDGEKTNNSLKNLREVDSCQNLQNQKIRTRFTGTILRPNGKWHARITANRVVHHLGVFSTSSQAHAAYLNAKEKLHGEFAR